MLQRLLVPEKNSVDQHKQYDIFNSSVDPGESEKHSLTYFANFCNVQSIPRYFFSILRTNYKSNSRALA